MGQKTYITADLHLGHKLVSGLRGFTDTDEHDEWIIQRINSMVGDTDTLYVLGDVSLSLKPLHKVKQIRGRKILIAGNHDACWHRRTKRGDVRRALRIVPTYYEAGFNEIITSGTMLHLSANNQDVVLTHLPVQGDHQEEDRYSDRRPAHLDYGLPVLCGHVHDAWRTKERQLNVGLDTNAYKPLLLTYAIHEAYKLKGYGANPNITVPGIWNEFGLA